MPTSSGTPSPSVYLKAAYQLEMVAKLLAHRDIRITQWHYSKWTKGRQEIMAAEIEKAWKLS
jgi:hypothetical protein